LQDNDDNVEAEAVSGGDGGEEAEEPSKEQESPMEEEDSDVIPSSSPIKGEDSDIIPSSLPPAPSRPVTRMKTLPRPRPKLSVVVVRLNIFHLMYFKISFNFSKNIISLRLVHRFRIARLK
jgi:hypothetical protein